MRILARGKKENAHAKNLLTHCSVSCVFVFLFCSSFLSCFLSLFWSVFSSSSFTPTYAEDNHRPARCREVACQQQQNSNTTKASNNAARSLFCVSHRILVLLVLLCRTCECCTHVLVVCGSCVVAPRSRGIYHQRAQQPLQRCGACAFACHISVLGGTCKR